MAQKQIHLDNIGLVLLQKRKGTRNIRLTVGHDGTLRVSMPSWSPYKVGEAFAISKGDWIRQQKITKTRQIVMPNERIGKGHRVRYVNEQRRSASSRITNTEIIVRLPMDKKASDEDVQKVVHEAAIRALKQEAKILLPQRLATLAQKHGFEYNSVSIKKLRSRWGSCNSKQEIALNCFLMQLPWDLIDYVLMHELLHTKIMAHGKTFWDELDQYVPDLSGKRKSIRALQPILASV